MAEPTVEVLLSTHNGAAHLHEQVDSILAQQDVRVRLLARDDGSSDDTMRILRSYAHDPRVRVCAGENLGLPHGYFHLIEHSRPDADYWALADQDDVWLPHKLSRAAEALSDREQPALYCARVLVVDERLHPLYPHPMPRRGPSFANALVQNIATGCTIVFNAPARSALQGRWPEYAVMHDAWLYLVISGTGTVLYDSEVVVLYRQHTRNAVGMGGNRLTRTLRRVQRQFSFEGAGAHGRQNHELRQTHRELLTPRARCELDGALIAWSGGPVTRARYALRGPVHRQTKGSNVVLQLLQVFGRV